MRGLCRRPEMKYLCRFRVTFCAIGPKLPGKMYFTEIYLFTTNCYMRSCNYTELGVIKFLSAPSSSLHSGTATISPGYYSGSGISSLPRPSEPFTGHYHRHAPLGNDSAVPVA